MSWVVSWCNGAVPDDDPTGLGDDVWDRLSRLPSLDEAPLDATWSPAPPGPAGDPAAPSQRLPQGPGPDEPGRAIDERRIRVGAAVEESRPTTTPTARPDSAHDAPAHDRPPDLHPDEIDPLPQRRRARPRRRFGRVVLALVTLALLATAGFGITGWVMWNRVDKIDTGGTLASGDPFTNYLIVGTDSRAGVSEDLETADSIGLRVDGNRSDTMVVLHIGDAGNHMVSLPRDLWVDYASGGQGKLNGARSIAGVPELIATVAQDPGIPVHHYLEVDIAGFLSVIEAVGSITIDFARPACDPKSGLDIRVSGPVALGAEQALAYVRSRTYTEFDAAAAAGLDCDQIRARRLGTGVGNADFGRTERQRRFLLAVFDRVSASRNPVTLLRVLGGMSDGLRVDDTMGMFDAIDLLRDLRGLDADAIALPVSDFTTASTSALQLNAESAAVLELLSPPPTPG